MKRLPIGRTDQLFWVEAEADALSRRTVGAPLAKQISARGEGTSKKQVVVDEVALKPFVEL